MTVNILIKVNASFFYCETYDLTISTNPKETFDHSLNETNLSIEEDDQVEEYDENDYIIARACYDYEAGDTDEINLKAGEIVFVFLRHESGNISC
jgi:hypothetical protein